MRVKMAMGSTLKDERGKVLAEPGEEVEVEPKIGKALVEGRSAEPVQEKGKK